jgi:hypothetical protein
LRVFLSYSSITESTTCSSIGQTVAGGRVRAGGFAISRQKITFENWVKSNKNKQDTTNKEAGDWVRAGGLAASRQKITIENSVKNYKTLHI